MKVAKAMTCRQIVGLVAIVVAVGFALSIMMLYFFIWRLDRYALKQRVRLLYETDHQALLEACRELLRCVSAGDLKLGTYHFGSHPDPEVLTFPQVILYLAPNSVSIDESGRVVVAMTGGLDHCGVYAYLEDYESPPGGGIYRDRKLIEGLWYYDEQDDVDYRKRIDALGQKRKQAHQPER